MTSEDLSRIHEAGVERHGDRWYHANRRAVEVLWGSRLKVDSPEVKETLPMVLYKVLNGMMVDQGMAWKEPSVEFP